MTNANVLQIIQNIHENLTTTHTVTHIYIWDIIKISTYLQIYNILGIKLCLAVELTSEGSVKLWALCRRLWPVSLGCGKSRCRTW